MGAPYWDMYARGTIVGITRGTNRNHMIRAAEEAIAYQCKDLLDAMLKDTGMKVGELRVDGGASADAFLMQFQADIMGVDIQSPLVTETTALGAAYLAGLATGVWRDMDEIRSCRTIAKTYSPCMQPQKAAFLCDDWHRAVQRALGWAAH
jgi:glycerol kinase